MFYVFEVLDVCFVSFCFGREIRMFGTSIVQVVEQMNRKVDLTRLNKLRTVRVGHFSSKATTKNSLPHNKRVIAKSLYGACLEFL